MSIILSKGQKVSLSKEAPGMTHVMVGLGWDTNCYDGGNDFDLYENVWRRVSERYNVDVLLSTVKGELGIAFEWFWSFEFAKERGIRNAQEAELALSVTAYLMVRDFPYAEVYYGISPCSDEYEILLFVPIEHIADFEATANEDLEEKYRLEKCDILH